MTGGTYCDVDRPVVEKGVLKHVVVVAQGAHTADDEVNILGRIDVVVWGMTYSSMLRTQGSHIH